MPIWQVSVLLMYFGEGLRILRLFRNEDASRRLAKLQVFERPVARTGPPSPGITRLAEAGLARDTHFGDGFMLNAGAWQLMGDIVCAWSL
jgi:hypothetical protein